MSFRITVDVETVDAEAQVPTLVIVDPECEARCPESQAVCCILQQFLVIKVSRSSARKRSPKIQSSGVVSGHMKNCIYLFIFSCVESSLLHTGSR